MFHDVYVASNEGDCIELRCDGAALILPPDAVFCGVTAARLLGVPVPDRDVRVHAAVPSTRLNSPRIKQLKVHSYSIPAGHLRVLDGRRVISVERLFLELAATLARIELIIAGDHILRRGLSTRSRLTGFLNNDCHRRRGVAKAKLALPLLDEKSDSPPETRLRMLIVDANLPRPVVNRDVYNAWDVWLARPDLSYPALKIAIEYEGVHHQQDRQQYSHDIERDGRLIDEGWIVIRVSKEALFTHPRTVINRVRKAIAQRTPR
ncbi:DUF559 domain-containing protein [Actinomadura sp. LD22]|uniref:DUF559 domain-containing protein n=1 Tax=Actinomadura physcomitrii TaxID=2650748 RepID=A0A6I4MK57_9ACTN|nr:DUF559 domain-containing protein [Actinomadura physcomitrii]MWA02626.1 DUF559 domain-containing protein [Actinomadura physcomitrii]